METYKDDPCTVFGIKGVSDYHSLEQELGRKMHKAIAMIQFKLEGQLLRERREFHMEDRCLLHRIDPEKGSIVMPDGKEYALRDNLFPTIDWEHPYELTAGVIPQLLEGLPFGVFATSSIDALVHAVESSLSPKATPYTKLFGYKAIEMLIRGISDDRPGGAGGPPAPAGGLPDCVELCGLCIRYGWVRGGARHELPAGGKIPRAPRGEQLRDVYRRVEELHGDQAGRRACGDEPTASGVLTAAASTCWNRIFREPAPYGLPPATAPPRRYSPPPFLSSPAIRAVSADSQPPVPTAVRCVW